MSIARRFAVSVVVGLLTLTLLTGNVVVTGHQTALDPDFVNATLAEEEAYEDLHETVLEGGEFPFAGGDSLPPFATDVAADVITPEYLRNQTEANVGRLYAYLHGNRDDPGIAVDLTPAVEDTDDAVEATVRNTTVRELIEQTVGTENIASEDLPINGSTVLMLTDGPEEYREARDQLRSQIRERILDRLVDEAFEAASNDELLLLVGENPLDYETEADKEAFIEDNEAEIKQALRERILAERGDEIDQQVNQTLDETRSSLKDDLSAPDTGLGEEVDRAAGDLLAVFVDGLAARDYTYEEFRSDLDSAKGDLAVVIGDFAQSELEAALAEQDRVENNRITLTEDLPADTRQQLSRARTGVGVLDILGIALPAVALVLVGLLWLLSSVGTAALWAGVAALLAGIPGFLGAEVGGTRLQQVFAANAPQSGVEGEFADLGLSLVEGVLGQLGAQSLWLTAAGGLFALAGAALRFGLLDDYVGSTDSEPGDGGDDGDRTGADRTAGTAGSRGDADTAAVEDADSDAPGGAEDSDAGATGAGGGSGADGGVDDEGSTDR